MADQQPEVPVETTQQVPQADQMPSEPIGVTDPVPIDRGAQDHRHLFDTGKARLGFFMCCVAQLCIFTMYNICGNLASTIHGDNAVIAMSIVYGTCIIITPFTPLLITIFKGRATAVMFMSSLCYIAFAISNLYARIYTLCIGGFILGFSAPMWTSNAINVSQLSVYCAERELLRQIQRGELCDQLVDGVDPENHHLRMVTDPRNPHQIDWYLSTILDKNNRIILHKLTRQQLDVFTTLSDAQVGTYTTISWLFMQASSIVGALIAFGALHIRIGSDPAGHYESDTGSVRIMYGILSFICIMGAILYFVAMKIIPLRVYFTANLLSKWDLHLRSKLLEYHPSLLHPHGIVSMSTACVHSLQYHAGEAAMAEFAQHHASPVVPADGPNSPASPTSALTLDTTQPKTNTDNATLKSPFSAGAMSPATASQVRVNALPTSPISPNGFVSHIQCPQCESFCNELCVRPDLNPHNPYGPLYTTSRHLFPGRAANDPTDDDNVRIRPPLGKLVTHTLLMMWRTLKEPAIFILFPAFLTAYAPFSFCVSAFSSKGGVKDAIGVMYVPLFIAIVAGADVFGAFVLKLFLSTHVTARICAICGLCIQLTSVILMRVFPYTGWNSPGETWKFISIIGVLMGLGDSASVSGLSTLVSCLTRSHSPILSAGSTLLMTSRALGLCLMFALTANTNKVTFRSIFWPIVVALISLSILCHILSFICNFSVNTDRVLSVGAYSKSDKKLGEASDVEMADQLRPDAAAVDPSARPQLEDAGSSQVVRRHKHRRRHRFHYHFHPHLSPNDSIANLQMLTHVHH